MAANTTSLPNITANLSSSQHDASYAEDVMAMAKKMHWVTSSICGTLFVVLGLIGNILSIFIWRKPSMKSSTGQYLIAQAFNDIGVLVFFFLTDPSVIIWPHLKTWYWYGVFHSYIGYPMFFFFVVNSIWTLVGVTLNRYIQVCFINQAKTICNEENTRMGIILITVLSFIVNTPHFNTYNPIPVGDRQPTDPAYDFTDFGQGSASKMYEFWVHCMFIVLVPWITILTMNMAILRRVTLSNRQMQGARGEKAKVQAMRKENQLTKVLLTVTFTFLMLIALQCITQCFFMLQPEISDLRIVNEAFSVAKLGIVINSSINFILYCCSAKRFRAEIRITLYKLCGWRCMVPIPGSSDLYFLSNKSNPAKTVQKASKTAPLSSTIPTSIY